MIYRAKTTMGHKSVDEFEKDVSHYGREVKKKGVKLINYAKVRLIRRSGDEARSRKLRH